MAADVSRLEALRRRVQQDPASFAFAALAEEYRKGGQLQEAVATCRKGLERHPSYTAGRVTLARALMAMGEASHAAAEFEEVLKAAPENLAARRGLAELERERGDLVAALAGFRLAAALAPQDPELAQCVASLEQEIAWSASATSLGTPAPAGESTQRSSNSDPVVFGSAIAPDRVGDLISAEPEPLAGSVPVLPGEDETASSSEYFAPAHDLLWLETPGTSAIDPVIWSNEWELPIAAGGDDAFADLKPASARADEEDLGDALMRNAPGGEPDDGGPSGELACCDQTLSAGAGADPGSDFVEGSETWAAGPPALALVDLSADVVAVDELDLALVTEPTVAPIDSPAIESEALIPDAAPAALRLVQDPVDESAPDDPPLDPRLDALENFLEAVVRSRSARR